MKIKIATFIFIIILLCYTFTTERAAPYLLHFFENSELHSLVALLSLCRSVLFSIFYFFFIPLLFVCEEVVSGIHDVRVVFVCCIFDVPYTKRRYICIGMVLIQTHIVPTFIHSNARNTERPKNEKKTQKKNKNICCISMHIHYYAHRE